jgi:hypothetical protein
MSIKLILLLTLVAALAFGCGKKTTYSTKDGEVKVDKQGGQVTIESKTKDGKATITANNSGVALPDKFPTDVPIYKGAVVKLSSTQDKAMMVHMEVPASATDALKFYQDQLKDQGWEIESTANMGGGSMLSAKKAGRQCTTLVLKQDKGTIVRLTVTEKGS